VAWYHGLDCPKLRRRGILWRHDRIVQIVARAVREAGGSASIEERLHGENHKKPDLKILLGNNVIWGDVVVTNPLAPSHITSAQKRLGATTQAEKRKHAKYDAEVKRVGGDFVAFNLETTGAVGRGAEDLVRRIMKAHIPEYASMPATALRALLTKGVACAIQNLNAVAMEEWLHAADVLQEPAWQAPAAQEEEE